MAKKIVTKREVEVTINPYEFMLILSPELRETEVTKKLKEITDMIEKAGGKITHEDFWGKKPFAYRLKKHWDGIYMVYNLELPNNFLRELKDHLRIEKEVLRSMIIKIPADYTYTNFELEVVEEKRERKPRKEAPKAEAPKKVVPQTEEDKKIDDAISAVVDLKKDKAPSEEKKEEVKEEKKEEKTKEDVDKYKSDLDKKLDAILGDEDLNL